ncbi:MAG: hypothetical protein ABIG39_05230, partial [Candidatus Micrarchaeota archaeon]
RGILIFLANEERRHLEFFENLLNAHGKDDGKIMSGLRRPRIFPEKQEYLQMDSMDVDREILKNAKEAEQKSIEYYSGIDCDEEVLCNGLEVIIKEEKQHLEWIEYLIDGLGTHEYWTGLQDHFSLD